MSNFLHEAFQALKLTESETFELDKAGVADLSDFLSTDFQLEDTTVDIIDPEAETEEDLQKTYIGEVILECQACHVPHYCHPEDVVIDEEAGLANIEDTCPNCYSNEGFKVVGTVAPYEDITVEANDDVEVEVDGKEISTEETEKEEVEVNDNLDEAKTAIDKDALKKRFAGRFTTKESLSLREKRLVSAKKHLTRKNKEEDIEACQKNPVDTEKSIAGELKEAKKRHLTRKEKEETLQKCQKGEVDVTKAPAGELKEAKKRHLTRNEDEEKLLKCQKGKVDTTKSTAGELKEEKASCEDKKCGDKKQLKRRHITKNNDDEALEICQKNPVDTTKSEAGKLREAKKRHLTRNEDEEKLLKCQKGNVDTTKSIAGELKESDAPAATSVEDAQEWVDYDMKKYGHISDKTNELVKKAGFQIVKDQYGDYEVIAGKYDESLEEAKVTEGLTNREKLLRASSVTEDIENLEEGIFKTAFNFTIRIWSNNGSLAKFGKKFVERLDGEVTGISTNKLDFKIKRTDIDSLKTTKGLEKFIERIKSNFSRYASEYNKTADGDERIEAVTLQIGIQVDANLFKKGKTRENILENSTLLYRCDLTAPTFLGGGVNAKSANWETEGEDSNVEQISKRLRSVFESLNEGMEDISITTGDEVIKIKATPRADKETVVPPAELAAEEETEEVEEGAVEEMPDLEDVEIEEVDEESFDSLGESYLKRAYNNVKSFKTQKAMQSKNALVLEGKIEFKSGKVATTRFIFEAANKDKKGNLQFLGLNENLAKKKGAFKLSASVTDKKLFCESLNYNYHGKDLKSGKSQRLYGTVKNR